MRIRPSLRSTIVPPLEEGCERASSVTGPVASSNSPCVAIWLPASAENSRAAGEATASMAEYTCPCVEGRRRVARHPRSRRCQTSERGLLESANVRNDTSYEGIRRNHPPPISICLVIQPSRASVRVCSRHADDPAAVSERVPPRERCVRAIEKRPKRLDRAEWVLQQRARQTATRFSSRHSLSAFSHSIASNGASQSCHRRPGLAESGCATTPKPRAARRPRRRHGVRLASGYGACGSPIAM